MEESNADTIGEDLDKLFAFQDKHMTEKKKALLVDALLTSGIPLPAVTLGIRKLMNEDLNSVKLGMIFAAARSFVQRDEESNSCPDCSSGMVVMRDEEGRWFSLACRCGIGANVARTHGLKRWGGLASQTSNGRILTKA